MDVCYANGNVEVHGWNHKAIWVIIPSVLEYQDFKYDWFVKSRSIPILVRHMTIHLIVTYKRYL